MRTNLFIILAFSLLMFSCKNNEDDIKAIDLNSTEVLDYSKIEIKWKAVNFEPNDVFYLKRSTNNKKSYSLVGRVYFSKVNSNNEYVFIDNSNYFDYDSISYQVVYANDIIKSNIRDVKPLNPIKLPKTPKYSAEILLVVPEENLLIVKEIVEGSQNILTYNYQTNELISSIQFPHAGFLSNVKVRQLNGKYVIYIRKGDYLLMYDVYTFEKIKEIETNYGDRIEFDHNGNIFCYQDRYISIVDLDLTNTHDIVLDHAYHSIHPYTTDRYIMVSQQEKRIDLVLLHEDKAKIEKTILLQDGISYYTLLSNNKLIFSQGFKGIFVLDLSTWQIHNLKTKSGFVNPTNFLNMTASGNRLYLTWPGGMRIGDIAYRYSLDDYKEQTEFIFYNFPIQSMIANEYFFHMGIYNDNYYIKKINLW